MISVIVPVYNTGKTLNKCLKSIVNQTYKDFEIILVNDCSTDKKTKQLISDWVKSDSRIVLIDKIVNEGVDKARYDAIQVVKGDFLTFVDSDDWIEKDALQSLLSISKQTGAEVVIGKMRKIYWKGLLKKNDAYKSDWMGRLITHEELMEKYFLSYFGVNILPVNLCAVLFRTSVVKAAEIKPSGLKFGEDLLMSMQIFPHINSLFAVNKVVYNYIVGIPSISDKYLDSWLESARNLYLKKMATIERMHYDKALFFQNAELMNYLRSFVFGCSLHRPNQKTRNIDLLKQEFENPIYKRLSLLMDFAYRDKESVRLILGGDAEGFYNRVEEMEMKSIKKNPKIYVLSLTTRLLHLLHFKK